MDVSRRTLIVGGTSAIVGAGVGAGVAGLVGADRTGPTLWQRGDRNGAPRVGGLHLQYGASAASEVVVSWHTAAAVNNPRVMLGTPDDGVGHTVAADTATYRDAASRTEIRVHHARLAGLAPDTDYVYAAVHDGASPEVGTVRTAPRGRAPLRFTSFGDQSTPTLDALVAKAFGSDNRGSPAAGDITTAVERAAPLFNLINGDLCYANLSRDRVRTWSDWFENNSRSARYRPWMPAAGNHENELGNGPIGYSAYQAYFALPDSGSDPELRGLWYAFTAGSVRVISLANDDVCYQDGGNSYVRGYSGGAQKRWLEQELERTRSDSGIDWIVVCMHQTAVSTGERTNGADLGIRENWLPLFDRFGVDLVVCGHEHHYERTHAIREPCQPTRRRRTRSTRNRITSTPARARFIWSSAVEARRSRRTRCSIPSRGARSSWRLGMSTPTPVTRRRGMSRKPHRGRSFGTATIPAAVAFEVDPGQPGGNTSMAATYYAVNGPFGEVTPVDKFTLTRPRRG